MSLKTYVLYFTEFVSENSENIGVENTTNLSLYHFHGTQVRSLPTLSLSPYQQNQNNATSQLILHLFLMVQAVPYLSHKLII